MQAEGEVMRLPGGPEDGRGLPDVLRGRAPAAVQDVVLRHRGQRRGRRPDAGGVPEGLGALGPDRARSTIRPLPVPGGAERLPDAGARRTPSCADAVPLGVVRDPFDDVDSAKTSVGCCGRSRRANAPPSSCSTCTATAPRTPPGSWASVRRPSARSRRRAEPCSERSGGPNG